MKLLIEKIEKGYVLYVLGEETQTFESESLDEVMELCRKYLGE